MDNTARITSTALCLYREAQETKFVELMAKARKLNKDNGAYDEDAYVIATHKALTAGIEYHDVNDMLGGHFHSVHVWDRELIGQVMPLFAERASEAYERAEARVEDAALTKFHHDAYGDD
jgi:hypothetical protein